MPDKVIIPPLSVSITADPKAGKNHLSYTFPDPIKVYCFNGGALWVARNKFPGKQIDVNNIALPILESTDDSSWSEPVWDAFMNEYKQDCESGKYKTLVLDTATELEEICRQTILESLKQDAAEKGRTKQKLASNEYAKRNLLMYALFNRARLAGVNLVTLQYLRDEWTRTTDSAGRDKAEKTGRRILEGWDKTEAAVDVALQLEETNDGGKAVTKAFVVRNRFDRNLNRQTLKDTDYQELIALLRLV